MRVASAAADEGNDFELVAIGESVFGVTGAGHELEIDFDGDAARGDFEGLQELRDC
jgi:hypothetical protein